MQYNQKEFGTQNVSHFLSGWSNETVKQEFLNTPIGKLYSHEQKIRNGAAVVGFWLTQFGAMTKSKFISKIGGSLIEGTKRNSIANLKTRTRKTEGQKKRKLKIYETILGYPDAPGKFEK